MFLLYHESLDRLARTAMQGQNGSPIPLIIIRAKISALVDRLFDDYGIAVLSFDVVFSEPDLSSGLQTLNRLATGPLEFLQVGKRLLPVDSGSNMFVTYPGPATAQGRAVRDRKNYIWLLNQFKYP